MQSDWSSEPLEVVVGLGANLGDRRATLLSALSALEALGRVVCVSALYENEALGPPQPPFLNAAARLLTDLTPLELLEALLAIERNHGRVRRKRWGPRTLDLDLLWGGCRIVEHPRLQLPHSELSRRTFALRPLLDVAPAASDPTTGKPYAETLEVLDCSGLVRVGWRDRG
jgi:2-amino-4-hydroxy-6-hydroxymethyldihydropteridine diphosphokinase